MQRLDHGKFVGNAKVGFVCGIDSVFIIPLRDLRILEVRCGIDHGGNTQIARLKKNALYQTIVGEGAEKAVNGIAKKGQQAAGVAQRQ